MNELISDADDMWYLFRYLNKMKERPKELMDKNLDNIFEVSKFAGMKAEDQDRYFRELMYEMDQRASLRTAHKRGVTDVARKMKTNGLSTDMIIKCTGLTEEQIDAL